jgi:hypothetical protein
MFSGAAVGGVSTRKSLVVARIGRDWNISVRFFCSESSFPCRFAKIFLVPFIF